MIFGNSYEKFEDSSNKISGRFHFLDLKCKFLETFLEIAQKGTFSEFKSTSSKKGIKILSLGDIESRSSRTLRNW